jgi:hypothetical protein
LVEVDWQSLFRSFFAMVRIKIKCRNPARVPKHRIMEMKDEIFLISFKTEGVEQVGGEVNDDGNGGGEYDLEEDDLLDDEEGSDDKDKRKADSDSSKKGNREIGESSKSNSQIKSSTLKGSKSMKNLINIFAKGENDMFNSV